MTIAEQVAEIADFEGIDLDACQDEFPHAVADHTYDRGYRYEFADGSVLETDNYTWWVEAAPSLATQEG